MSWASYLILGLFLFATATAVWWASDRGTASARRFGILAVCFSATFLLLALWWRVPLDARIEVDRATRMAASITPERMSCSEVERVIPVLERASKGLIRVTSSPEVQIPARMWSKLSREQRGALISIASKANQCAFGGKRDRKVFVRDSETGETLAEERIHD